jgi:hypothetical protein
VKVQLQGCEAKGGPRDGPFPRFPFLRAGKMRMMGVAAKFDARHAKKREFIIEWIRKIKNRGAAKQEKWITWFGDLSVCRRA